MSVERSKIKVAIAGGGIAGLALAAGLEKKHKHLDFHVYEATTVYKNVGAGLAIHLNGIKAMELVNPALKQAYFEKGLLMGEEDLEMGTEVIMAHGQFEGERIVELGRAKGRKTVSRADLLDGFSALVSSDRISFGKRLQNIEQDDKGVKLTFRDGSTAQADFLIGADGVHSISRRYILGPDHPSAEPVNHERWQIYNRTMPMEVARQHIAERWTQAIPILLGPGGYINSMPLSKGSRLSASVVLRRVEGAQNISTPELISKHYHDYSQDARSIAELVAQDSILWEPIDHDHAPVYFRGNVAMIGDAAHATMGQYLACSPRATLCSACDGQYSRELRANVFSAFNGQGAAQALEDVAVLDHLFSYLTSLSQLEALFSAYDVTRRPRSQKVVEISRQFGRIYAYAEGDLHENPTELRKVMGAGGAYTNGADLVKQNDDAMKAFQDALNRPANGSLGGK